MRIKPNYSFMRETFVLKKRMLVFIFCLFATSIASAHAQTKTITGTVVDEQNEPLPSVTIVVKGTTNGTITDFDGNYSIEAKNGDILEVSFIGMKTKFVTVTSSKHDVVLQEDIEMLGEVVVIGYGSAKAKDLTSPIATVNGEELTKHLTTSPMQGMQGKVAGIQIVGSGQPGSSPTVRIRGIGNMDKDKQGPLYVVDGMFFDNIDFLSNNDIESLNILKDASSSAIYGVRAANGVVIITTKKGIPNRKPQITYDGFIGFQQATNVMKMANSEQYAKMFRGIDDVIAGKIDRSVEQWGGANGIPSTNTDWYKELLKTAAMHSHSVDITGGAENISYAVGVNYLNQDGILNVQDNGYERLNTRARFDFTMTEWLKGGVNFFLTNDSKQENSGSVWTNAYYNPSIYPVYDKSQKNDRNPEGFASGKQIGLDDFFWNPVAIAYYEQNKVEKSTRLLPSYYLQASFFEDKLTLRSAVSQELKFMRRREVIPEHEIGSNQIRNESYLQKRSEFKNNWIVDNTITFRDSKDKHNYSFMLGNSVRQEHDELMRLEAKGVPTEESEYWYIKNGEQIIQNLKDEGKFADNGNIYRGVSYFGRLMYDFKGKYLLSATLRADGSSKYQEKWGYFPSVGLGWVVSEESFAKNLGGIDFLKLRANWGKLGNDKIEASTGFASMDKVQGIFEDVLIPGITQSSFFSFMKWEVVEEYDLGFDLTFMKNRMSVTFDYFDRTTNNAVFKKKISLIPGTILSNGAKVNNKGIELTINWNDKIGNDFSYNIGLNGTYVKNKVTDLDGRNHEMMDNNTQAYMIGYPVSSFYGYKVTGVYQNQAEIEADPIAVANKLEPGDFKFFDADGDKELTAGDRVYLGSHIPKYRLGGNLGFTYKNLDFNTALQGMFDYELFNRKRFLRSYRSEVNFDKDWVDNVWSGEGSTNKYPSAKGSTKGWNIQRVNSFFIEKANTFTIQNIALGYTFKNIFPKSQNQSSLRLSLTAERPFSFFTYNGFTTDVPDGLDADVYPLASTYSFGLKLIY